MRGNNQTTVTEIDTELEKAIIYLGTIEEKQEKGDQQTRTAEPTDNPRLDNIEKDISEIKKALKETTTTLKETNTT